MDATAIATLAVAAVTAILALATWRLGSRATEENRAQWRPVLIAKPEHEVRRLGAQGIPVANSWPPIARGDDGLSLVVSNVGRGPALDVTATSDQARPAVPHAIIGQGDVGVFKLGLPGPTVRAAVVNLGYTDISGVSYATLVLVALDEDSPRLLSQRVEILPTIFFWWLKLVPDRVRRLWRWVARRRGYRVPMPGDVK